jgi:hypothetical protein
LSASEKDERDFVDLNAMRRPAGAGAGASARAPMRAGLRGVAVPLLAALVVLLPIDRVGAEDGAPLVSADRIDDVPSTGPDPYPAFDNFAWRAFIALNWPSLTDPAHRGVPDRAKAPGDPGPRVWETFKSRYELFQVGPDGRPTAPEPWATYEARNPCGAEADSRVKTLATFEPFLDFNQSAFLPGVAANPLVAQNRTYARYEVRINEPEYWALSLTGWSQGENLPDEAHPAHLPAGSIAVKAAWRLLTPADTPAIRARYYVVENAEVVDVAKTLAAGRTVCSMNDIALVGLHIVIRTTDRPQGLWSTFEHVDNVPPVGAGEARAPDAREAGAPYSFFDASKPDLGLWPTFGSPDTLPVSVENPPKLDPAPMQVVRRHPIHASTMAMNRAYWAAPGIRGTVWEHYMLVASQWPTVARPVDPQNDGAFFPGPPPPPDAPRESYQTSDRPEENPVNTTIETYLQDPPSSCMSCHQSVSNALGRDFVGILASFR